MKYKVGQKIWLRVRYDSSEVYTKYTICDDAYKYEQNTSLYPLEICLEVVCLDVYNCTVIVPAGYTGWGANEAKTLALDLPKSTKFWNISKQMLDLDPRNKMTEADKEVVSEEVKSDDNGIVARDPFKEIEEIKKLLTQNTKFFEQTRAEDSIRNAAIQAKLDKAEAKLLEAESKLTITNKNLESEIRARKIDVEVVEKKRLDTENKLRIETESKLVAAKEKLALMEAKIAEAPALAVEAFSAKHCKYCAE